MHKCRKAVFVVEMLDLKRAVGMRRAMYMAESTKKIALRRAQP
jgi:hypothetical protein